MNFSRFDDVLIESPFPWWKWDVEHDRVCISPQKVEMLGYPYADFIDVGYEAYTRLLHPDDWERTMNAMRALLQGRSDLYQVDYRIRAQDGSYHWYMDRGIILERSSEHQPRLIRGIVLDLGQHVLSQKPFAILIHLLRSAMPTQYSPNEVLSVCSNCLRVQSDQQWLEISSTLSDFIGVPKSHTLCPDCIRSLYPELADEILERMKND